MSITNMRWGLGVIGVLVGLYGAYLLQSRSETEDLVSAATWLVGGVIIHDGLIAFATIALVALSARVLPAAARGPATVGFVVLGTLSVVAIPFLGEFGARSDNPTLLDRNYVVGYAVYAVIVVAAVVVASLRKQRHGSV